MINEKVHMAVSGKWISARALVNAKVNRQGVLIKFMTGRPAAFADIEVRIFWRARRA